MLLFFWRKGVLSEQRKQALTNFRKQAAKALEELAQKTKDGFEKNLYNGMKNSIERTPLKFYPRTSLKGKIYRAGSMLFGTVTKGESVKQIRVIQQGNSFFIQSFSHISLPAEHIFSGDKLAASGVFTLCHEYAHFPKPGVKAFALHSQMGLEQAEEFLADMLAAKLAKQLGFSHETILNELSGREIVYGSIPFKAKILKALK